MIGSNVPAHPGKGGLSTLFAYAERWGCECAQTYITLSRTWKTRELSPEETLSFRTAWQSSSVKQVIAHVPLIVNPAAPTDAIWQNSKTRLATELSIADQLGIQLLVMHPGYFGRLGKKVGIGRTVDALNEVFNGAKASHAMILLETMAGQGTTIGSRFEELAEIIKRVEKSHSLDVCLDTCHVFAAGYDIRGYQGYENVLKEFDAKVGKDKLKMLHVNDSKGDLGCRIDRHMAIGEGKLGLQVFHAIVRDKRFEDTPKVLELPTRDEEKIQQQLRLLRKLQEVVEHVSEPKEVKIQSRLDESFPHDSTD
ncbi:MAG: deoxyribonuclease IV [Candidatus Bathyarchaeia archaeon]